MLVGRVRHPSFPIRSNNPVILFARRLFDRWLLDLLLGVRGPDRLPLCQESVRRGTVRGDCVTQTRRAIFGANRSTVLRVRNRNLPRGGL
jgi:hypothetical protein